MNRIAPVITRTQCLFLAVSILPTHFAPCFSTKWMRNTSPVLMVRAIPTAFVVEAAGADGTHVWLPESPLFTEPETGIPVYESCLQNSDEVLYGSTSENPNLIKYNGKEMIVFAFPVLFIIAFISTCADREPLGYIRPTRRNVPPQL